MECSVNNIKTYHRSKVSLTLTLLTSVMAPLSTDTICNFNPLYPAETGRGSFPVCEKSITLRCSAHKSSWARLNGVQSMLSDHQPKEGLIINAVFYELLCCMQINIYLCLMDEALEGPTQWFYWLFCSSNSRYLCRRSRNRETATQT